MSHSHNYQLFASPSKSLPPTPLSHAELQEELQMKLEEETCWRTNLMLGEEEQRVQQRDLLFRRRTSFEENVLNAHLQRMKRVLEDTGIELAKTTLPTSDKSFSAAQQEKRIDLIEGNGYLSEEEKWEISQLVLGNQQNFSILMRLATLFLENKEELAYLLCKIIQYVSRHIPCTPHQRKKPSPEQLIEAHKQKVVEAVLTQENIRVVAPDFFSNQNEEPLMAILYVWLHAVLCVKNGIYGSSESMDLEDTEEDNFFDD